MKILYLASGSGNVFRLLSPDRRHIQSNHNSSLSAL